jgi:hypothetical protein
MALSLSVSKNGAVPIVIVESIEAIKTEFEDANDRVSLITEPSLLLEVKLTVANARQPSSFLEYSLGQWNAMFAQAAVRDLKLKSNSE